MRKKGSGAIPAALVVMVLRSSLLFERSLSWQTDHFTVTTFVAEPPRLLRTVIFCGLDESEESPL